MCNEAIFYVCFYELIRKPLIFCESIQKYGFIFKYKDIDKRYTNEKKGQVSLETDAFLIF